ncbi:multiple sugar transport system permease protein/raffinose/stachyose/melibiose transport system permease protein [Microbacterium endophyticum]|uniref:Multiple sugar transport system permease protein/raffinose/stachyose/melibiose transport system permease protein n=1 Tax=Microbacterium endophyticum TaxID=1526412 RepID=A0A7W4V410_9MICO|nr:sugar ABC transporter permease [Microbacterium endophyticum]MBB2976410.1 multiple sugar transport system permease protein/raffinose/stachyose/melibiose transport system permease protein [Microbacterium endophyticum]NIK35856.1 multiple sugar transport system permease protein/raffinose/stachyose/melibiose transport system permease protein [Microbacterium endophyticum]
MPRPISPATGASRPGGRRGWTKPRLRGLPGWLFAAPSLLILLVFIVYPIMQSLWYSLHDWRIGADSQIWLGLGNYERLLNGELFWNALRVTLLFSLVSVVLQIGIGYWAANALVRETWFNRLVRSVFFFPTIVALATIGLVWRFLLDSRIGFVGGVVQLFGGEPVEFLQDPTLALPTIIFVSVWKTIGYAMIILLAGIKGVPDSLYEAARLDGANPRQLNWHVTLPSIRPTLLFVTMILTINSLQVFDLVYVMTNGGPLFATDTLVTMMYREGFTNFNLGYASAIAWVLFVIIMLLSAFQLRLFRYQDVD